VLFLSLHTQYTRWATWQRSHSFIHFQTSAQNSNRQLHTPAVLQCYTPKKAWLNGPQRHQEQHRKWACTLLTITVTVFGFTLTWRILCGRGYHNLYVSSSHLVSPNVNEIWNGNGFSLCEASEKSRTLSFSSLWILHWITAHEPCLRTEYEHHLQHSNATHTIKPC